MDIEMETDIPFASSTPESNSDLASELLSRYQNSANEDHQHLCAAIGAMAQALKDQQIPQTPVAYFGATLSSLDRLSRDPNSASDPVTPALLSFLSVTLSRVPRAVVRSKWDLVSEMVVRVMGFGSLPLNGVKAGLKCATSLVAVGEKGNWSKVSPLYGVVIGFVTDPRPKVRKQSHSCLHDVLESFQGSPSLVSASEGIVNCFERFLLLAGGSNSATSDPAAGPKGAMEVLYILNALRNCLSLMPMKHTTTIIKYCKSLVELRQPIVTRTIMEILQAFCSHPTSAVASETLIDLLCSLALSVAEKQNSADELAFIARLLHIGTKKVYDSNRQICIVKLPLIFNTLGEILSCEHEEAIYAATEALKSLVSSCVDEGLVQQGVEQITLSVEGQVRKSAPTVVEKICATMEGLLGYQYNAVWDMSFQILSAAFYQLGKASSTLMAESIKSLVNLQNLPAEDFPFRKQLHECVGSTVGAIGPELFLSLLPLNLDADDISDTNAWLLPILKQYTVGASLKFFSNNILDMVGVLQHRTQKLEMEGRAFSAKATEGLVYQLWSLLPAFCNYPVDTSKSFKELHTILCNTLNKHPELNGIICSSLQILIRQNRSALGDGVNSSMPNVELSIPERKAKELYTQEFAEDNLNAIRSLSSKILPVLSDVFLKTSKDNGGCLQSTVREFASISEKAVVNKFFKRIIMNLLRLTEKASKGKQVEDSSSMQIDQLSKEASVSHARALHLDLAVSLLPGLDREEIDVLFSVIKFSFQDGEGFIQKKAYRTLSIILKECDDFLSSKVDELIPMMIEATESCHFSAKHHRLDSLYYLIVYISKNYAEQRKRDSISAFLTEIILALKEANRKTRNRAYDLLVEIGHACGDEEQGGDKNNLLNFFNMIAGGLKGEKPHMISAAVKGLARLAYEFSDLIGAAFRLLPSVKLLLQRKNREIIKANLGLVKVLVTKSKAEGLQDHLSMLVEGLLKLQDDAKNHFKAKIKLLLEMLVRKCGVDAIKAVMPEEHMKLLTNIRKTKERKERKERKSRSEQDSESLHTKTSISRTIRKLQASKSLPEDLLDQIEDDPLDLLDRQRTRSALQSSARLKRKTTEDEPELDSDGRLVVREDGSYIQKRKSLSDNESDRRSQASGRLSAKSSTKAQKKRQKTSDSGWAYTGNEYTSRKASGDLKKKDKLDPYAYWPLDRKLLNRRSERKAVARKGMASVMKFTKRLEGKSASSALSASRVNLKNKGRKGKKNK